MSDVKMKNSGAQVLELPGIGKQRPISISITRKKILSYGNIFQTRGICPDGSDEILNYTSQVCNNCKWLNIKDTINWKGASGYHVTLRRCNNMSPCEGPMTSRDL